MTLIWTQIHTLMGAHTHTHMDYSLILYWMSEDKINTGICIVGSQISIALKIRAVSFCLTSEEKFIQLGIMPNFMKSETLQFLVGFVCLFASVYILKYKCMLSTCKWSVHNVLSLFNISYNTESILNNSQCYWMKTYLIWENHII